VVFISLHSPYESSGNKRRHSSAGSEHLPYKQRVLGSNPCASTKKARFFGLFLFIISKINLPLSFPSTFMILPQTFYVKRLLIYSTMVLMLCSIVGCQTRYGFRDKIKVERQEESKAKNMLVEVTTFVSSESNIFEKKVNLEYQIEAESCGIKRSVRPYMASINLNNGVKFVKEYPANSIHFKSSAKPSNPWFAGFVLAMVLGLIALILFAPAALIVSFLIILLFAYLILRIIRKGSDSGVDAKLGKEGREASKQKLRHRAVVLFMLLSVIFLFLGSIFFYPLIVPLLLCIPLLIVSFVALRNEPTKGRRLLYFWGLMLGLFLTIFFTAAIISFSPPG
jgi:hypothetical protein